MNFIGTLEGQEVHVELKYCERCGGLWLRAQGADGIYSGGCRACLAAGPKAVQSTAPLRRTQHRKRQIPQRGADIQGGAPQSTGRIDYLQGVAAMEVWG